ncbi:synaptonemal complex central element protein 1 isoform X2 [Parambassis ranga]|uniref:Synaptonemal complex central element protein 1 isoform X2 n=1 Tax=Parambassis ranga TaxID=210632 RepID=A0A6P7KD61_9TELE|nr:synaptonemal complex central element protein 1-like isoform X2 [Parambassis ranga]
MCHKRAKNTLESEIQEATSVRDSMQKELETLLNEVYSLEGIQQEKEELCQRLQFQCEESERNVVRQLNENKKSKELVEQYACEIQELKLKQRKQRMIFENQLYQLIDQHKKLNSVFTQERLPDEMASAENIKSQLSSVEELKLVQLHDLAKALEEMKNHNQSVPAETREDETCMLPGCFKE